jgi:pimeloyl-ACP methyl ester carboxylesterase
MKRNVSFFAILIAIAVCNSQTINAQAQFTEKMVDVGGYDLHFGILEGESPTILFESGAGDDGSVWKDLAIEIHEITGARILIYDRSGFGKSELNPHHREDDQFGIENGVQELENALSNLGVNEDLIFVSHSYGGFYTTLFSSRHPEKVLWNVRVDANLANSFTEEIFAKAEADNSIHELKEVLPLLFRARRHGFLNNT